MKKLLCAILLLLSFPACVCSESSTVSVSPAVAQSMLESALENGFAPQKDIETMLDNAFLNGYDFYNVKYTESSNTFSVEIAIDGFNAAITSLENSQSADSAERIEQVKETIVSHCDAILDLLDFVGMDDVKLRFTIIDDENVIKHGLRGQTLVNILHHPNGERTIRTFGWGIE